MTVADQVYTDEYWCRVVQVAREHALFAREQGTTEPPAPGDIVVEVTHTRERVIEPTAIGTLVWFPEQAAWDEAYPDLTRLTWDIIPLNGTLSKDGGTAITWENAVFLVVPDFDLVLAEAQTNL